MSDIHTDTHIFLNKITELGFGSYDEYLQSEHWQRFRKKFFKAKKIKKTCYLCRKSNWDVELHHRTYERLGKERLNDVIPVCRRHHEQLHNLLNERFGGDVRVTNRILYHLLQDRKRGSNRGKGLRRHFKGKKGRN